jgi:hypothetical protein
MSDGPPQAVVTRGKTTKASHVNGLPFFTPILPFATVAFIATSPFVVVRALSLTLGSNASDPFRSRREFPFRGI